MGDDNSWLLRETANKQVLHLGNMYAICIYLSIHLPIYLPIYLSIYLPIYLSIYLPIYQNVMLWSTLCFNLVLEALGGCGWRPPPILKSDWRGFGPIALRCWRWGRPMISIVSVCAAMLSRGGACWQGCWWDNNGRGVASGWCTIVSNGNWYVGKRKKKMNLKFEYK